MNIIIIDDDPNARRTLGKILKARGFEVDEAVTGAEAVASCGAKFFNLALIDVRLPDMSGLDVVKAVRGISRDTIAIMMTAYASLDSSIEAMNNGAYSYIIKPMNMDAVLSVIDRALEGQRLSMENRNLLLDLKKSNEDLGKAYDQLKKTQRELIQLEKTAAMGRFSIYVAHEVKNPMSIVLGGLEFLETKLPHSDKNVKNTMAIVKKALLRANSVLETLLHYSKPSDSQIEMISVSDVIQPVLDMVTRSASLANIIIDTEFIQDAKISVDKNQIHQALFNLLTNAIDAMPNGGKISIKIYQAIIPGALNEKMSCVIEVADTGSGISIDNIARVSEPFFTTKDHGKVRGTGLGLFITKMIIDSYNGKLLIESTEGKGSVMKIVLPLAE